MHEAGDILSGNFGFGLHCGIFGLLVWIPDQKNSKQMLMTDMDGPFESQRF